MTLYTRRPVSRVEGPYSGGWAARRPASARDVGPERDAVPRESMLTELKLRIREAKQGPDGLLYLLGRSPAKPGTETIRGGRRSQGSRTAEEDDETGVLLKIPKKPSTASVIQTRSPSRQQHHLPADRGLLVQTTCLQKPTENLTLKSGSAGVARAGAGRAVSVAGEVAAVSRTKDVRS